MAQQEVKRRMDGSHVTVLNLVISSLPYPDQDIKAVVESRR